MHATVPLFTRFYTLWVDSIKVIFRVVAISVNAGFYLTPALNPKQLGMDDLTCPKRIKGVLVVVADGGLMAKCVRNSS